MWIQASGDLWNASRRKLERFACDMEKMENIIDEAARLMAEIGFDQRQKNLNAEKQRTSREKYKVAVIGQFKAGKSTLINKTLLKEDVLFTDPSEATAVPTEIEYGPAPGALEIYPWLFQRLLRMNRAERRPSPLGKVRCAELRTQRPRI
jgi:hypothetical protein